jgi:hypothetical protein
VFNGRNEHNVVLELKFTGRFPDWFQDLVRHFALWKCSAAKYVDGVTLLRGTGCRLGQMIMPESLEAAENLEHRREFLGQIQERSELLFV